MRDCKLCKNKGWVDNTSDSPEIWQYCSCRHGKILQRTHTELNGSEVCPKCKGSGQVKVKQYTYWPFF